MAVLALLSLVTGVASLDVTDPKWWTIVLHLRLPRMIAAALAGSALALSGFVIQAILDNPLASPSILGIQAGAAFFSTLVFALFPFSLVRGPAAFAGALAAGGLILALCWKQRASRLSLVLAGLAISQIFSAGTDLLITLFPDSLSGYASVRIGTLSGISLSSMVLPGILILLCTVLLFVFSTQIDVLRLGLERAAALGLQAGKWMILLLGLAAGLAGSVIAFAGMLAFVGLAAPHLVRRLISGSLPRQMAGCLLVGSALLLGCDILARFVVRPYELPVSILLSLLGGPWFLYLLFARRRKA